MLVHIYLDAQGHECVAAGNEPYSWTFGTRTRTNEDGTAPELEGYTFLHTVDIQLPEREAALHVALANLKVKEAKIKQEAFEELQKVEETRQKLLALPSPTTKATFDDIPF